VIPFGFGRARSDLRRRITPIAIEGRPMAAGDSQLVLSGPRGVMAVQLSDEFVADAGNPLDDLLP